MGELDGKVAVITGAGSGMAKASVKIFVREGAKVVAADLSGAEKDTAAEVGERVLPVHCDVTNEADVEAMIGAAVEEFGRIDAVLNVAGNRRRLEGRGRHDGALRQGDGRRPARRAPRHEARDLGDAQAARGRGRHQLVVGRWTQRRAVHGCVLGGQGRGHLPDQVRGGGVRAQGDSRRTRSAPGSSTPRSWAPTPAPCRACSKRRRCSAAASRTKSPRSPRSSLRIERRSSPARSSRSTAGGPPSSPELSALEPAHP